MTAYFKRFFQESKRTLPTTDSKSVYQGVSFDRPQKSPIYNPVKLENSLASNTPDHRSNDVNQSNEQKHSSLESLAKSTNKKPVALQIKQKNTDMPGINAPQAFKDQVYKQSIKTESGSVKEVKSTLSQLKTDPDNRELNEAQNSLPTTVDKTELSKENSHVCDSPELVQTVESLNKHQVNEDDQSVETHSIFEAKSLAPKQLAANNAAAKKQNSPVDKGVHIREVRIQIVEDKQPVNRARKTPSINSNNDSRLLLRGL